MNESNVCVWQCDGERAFRRPLVDTICERERVCCKAASSTQVTSVSVRRHISVQNAVIIHQRSFAIPRIFPVILRKSQIYSKWYSENVTTES